MIILCDNSNNPNDKNQNGKQNESTAHVETKKTNQKQTKSVDSNKDTSTANVAPPSKQPSDDQMNKFKDHKDIKKTLNQFNKCFSKLCYLMFAIMRDSKIQLRTNNNKTIDLAENDISFEHISGALFLTESAGLKGILHNILVLFARSELSQQIFNALEQSGISQQEISESIRYIMDHIEEDRNGIYILDPINQEKVPIIRIEENIVYMGSALHYDLEKNTITISESEDDYTYYIIKEMVNTKVLSFGSTNKAYKDSKGKITIDCNNIDSIILRIEDKYLPKLLIDTIKKYIKSSKFNIIQSIHNTDSIKLVEDLHRLMLIAIGTEEKKMEETIKMGISSHIFKQHIDAKHIATEIIFSKSKK